MKINTVRTEWQTRCRIVSLHSALMTASCIALKKKSAYRWCYTRRPNKSARARRRRCPSLAHDRCTRVYMHVTLSRRPTRENKGKKRANLKVARGTFFQRPLRGVLCFCTAKRASARQPMRKPLRLSARRADSEYEYSEYLISKHLILIGSLIRAISPKFTKVKSLEPQIIYIFHLVELLNDETFFH